jgi:hypothetical protein
MKFNSRVVMGVASPGELGEKELKRVGSHIAGKHIFLHVSLHPDGMEID